MSSVDRLSTRGQHDGTLARNPPFAFKPSFSQAVAIMVVNQHNCKSTLSHILQAVCDVAGMSHTHQLLCAAMHPPTPGHPTRCCWDTPPTAPQHYSHPHPHPPPPALLSTPLAGALQHHGTAQQHHSRLCCTWKGRMPSCTAVWRGSGLGLRGRVGFCLPPRMLLRGRRQLQLVRLNLLCCFE